MYPANQPRSGLNYGVQIEIDVPYTPNCALLVRGYPNVSPTDLGALLNSFRPVEYAFFDNEST